MFLCYGATIEDQFEFIQRRWANSLVQPNLGGHDPVIGQNGRQGRRTRVIDFPTPAGSKRLKIKDEWVIPPVAVTFSRHRYRPSKTFWDRKP